jgi:hypothetical protein
MSYKEKKNFNYIISKEKENQFFLTHKAVHNQK